MEHRQYTPEELRTIRAYLETMLTEIQKHYDDYKRIIEGKLRWLNSIDQPSLFLVDSQGVVTVGTAIEGGRA